ncbi:hypothetical protein DY000_02057073 [Brassica cretica]|uniref:Uncharacterized protein n=1 Tax=Brassica cretica TaxID=69181 RepID=A0ABQ7AFC1_BRACR|nr:hypothetical protein DY000_02057073 [Brassica cretica]
MWSVDLGFLLLLFELLWGLHRKRVWSCSGLVVGLPCSKLLWRCVLVLCSLAVSSSSWRVRLVSTPQNRSGSGVVLLAAGSLSLLCFHLAVAVTEVGANRFLCSKLGFSWAIGLIPCLTVVYSRGANLFDRWHHRLRTPSRAVGLRSPFSQVCLWQLCPHSALASPWVFHCFAGARLRTWFTVLLV